MFAQSPVTPLSHCYLSAIWFYVCVCVHAHIFPFVFDYIKLGLVVGGKCMYH